MRKNKTNINFFHLKIIIFTAGKYYSILYGRVFLMADNLRISYGRILENRVAFEVLSSKTNLEISKVKKKKDTDIELSSRGTAT